MEQGVSMGIMEIYVIIKKRMWLIVAITGGAVFISAVMSFFFISPTYEAKTSIIIGQVETAPNKVMQYNDVMMYQKLVKTFVAIAKSQVVLQEAANELGYPYTPAQVMNSISITPEADTQIIYVKAQSSNPEEAFKIVNAHTKAFVKEAPVLYPAGSVKTIDVAVLPKSPVKPRPALNVGVAFFLGIVLSLGIIFIIERMDNTIKTESDVEKYLGLPVIGVIPKNTEA